MFMVGGAPAYPWYKPPPPPPPVVAGEGGGLEDIHPDDFAGGRSFSNF